MNLEKTAAAHAEEEQGLQEQFATQKQLASKYSDKVGGVTEQPTALLAVPTLRSCFCIHVHVLPGYTLVEKLCIKRPYHG